jgi:hypothetical protein
MLTKKNTTIRTLNLNTKEIVQLANIPKSKWIMQLIDTSKTYLLSRILLLLFLLQFVCFEYN